MRLMHVNRDLLTRQASLVEKAHSV